MIFEKLNLEHLKNLTIIKIGDQMINVAVVGRGVGFSNCSNISVNFLTSKVQVVEKQENKIKSYAVIDCTDGKKGHYFDAYIDFCGKVLDIEEIPQSVDKYSKDLKFGYIIKVQIYDFEFDLELQPDFQLSEIFKRITGLEPLESQDKLFIPKVGSCIKGTAEVIGILF